MYCSNSDCSRAKDFITLDIEIKNKFNNLIKHKLTTFYIEKFNSTEWLHKSVEFNLTSASEMFTFSFRMGREIFFNSSLAYLDIDKLRLSYLQAEDSGSNSSSDLMSINPVVPIVISCILAGIICTILATFLYKNYKRPPHFKMFDHFYRARQHAKLKKYTYEF